LNNFIWIRSWCCETKVCTSDLEDSDKTLRFIYWQNRRIFANSIHYLIATWLYLVLPRILVGSVLFIFLIFCIVYICFLCLRIVSSVLNVASVSRGQTYKRNQENTYTYSFKSNEQFIWLTVMEYMCHKWPRISSTCRKHFPVLSSFMTYQRVGN
jgi:hypothetical protein